MTTPQTLAERGLSCEALLKNLTELYRIDKTLAQQLDDAADIDNLAIIRAKNGQLTASVTLEDGRDIFLHSKYDPDAEAEKFVDRLDLDEHFVYFLSGIGLGYQAKRLLDESHDEVLIVIVEPELALIRAALSNIDFSDAIKTNRILFLHTLDKGIIHDKLMGHSTTMSLGTQLMSLMYTNQWHADFHKQMREFIADFSAFCRMSFITLVGNCRITQENVANNLWAYQACPPIDMLRQRFAGFPAILVSAGPSLVKNRHLLKEAKGKAVIIAVQTTLKPLLDMGVEPDFVTSLDYHELSCRFFENIDDFGDIHLIAEPKVNWKVPDTFTGKISLLDNDFGNSCLGDSAGAHGGLRSGSTVAHLSFYLAQYIGADPIVMIGQDLGFGGNLYYAPGNAIHDMWAVELNRFNTLEMKEWDRIMRHKPILRKIKDIHGEDIYTDEQMFTYLQQFERDFASCKAQVIDASEGGARKIGTVVMTLQEVLDTYANRRIDPEKFAYRGSTKWYRPEKLPEVVRQLTTRRDEVEQFRTLSEKTLDLLKQLTQLTDNPREFNKLIVKIDEIRSVVKTHHKTLQMVCSVSALAELRRFRHDRMIRASQSLGVDRAKKQLERDVQYIESVIQGCDDLDGVLARGLERVEEKMDAAGVEFDAETDK